jgi:DNA gyrase/topoisomerase IV subunit B
MNASSDGLAPVRRTARPRPLGADVAYDVEQIQVLEGLEPVRRRPGMYIGSTDSKGLHHMVWELVDNSVDEALAGECDRILVTLHADGSVSVDDNGRGIPVGIHPTEHRSTLEVVLTVLHAGAKFGGGGYKVASGLHGVGLSVVNALSERLQAWVYRDGREYFQEYRRGVPTAGVKTLGPSDRRGTKVRFWPDPDIFTDVHFDRDLILYRLREMAFLNKRLTLVLDDEVAGYPYTFYFEGGILSFVRSLNRGKVLVNQAPFYVEREVESTQIEIALQYNATYVETVLSFANDINTADGGSHVTGFRSALTSVINRYARKAGLLKESDPNLTGDDVREGLTAVISVKVLEPQFESQTKARLNNPEVQGQVSAVLTETFGQWLEENPSDGRRIVEKALTAARAREAARKARDLVQRKSVLESSALPGKLADCSDRDPRNCELFIVEGESAGGTAKGGRDRRTQAILPIKGKILNVEKSRLDRALTSEEIRNLITALGTGVGDRFDYSKLRYHRIVTMSVAGDEPTVVRGPDGGLELVSVGGFVDDCLRGLRRHEDYQVMCFDMATGATRFRPLKAVIRHSQEEPLYRLITRYGRSITVTASHSVFAVQGGRLVLRRGSDVGIGDLLAAPRQLPRASALRSIRLERRLPAAVGGSAGPLLAGSDVQVELNPDLMLTLGWYQAAGSEVGGRVALRSQNPRARERLVAVARRSLGSSVEATAAELQLSPEASELILALDGAGSRPGSTDAVLSATPDLQAAFLEGWLLGAGAIGKGGWSLRAATRLARDRLLYLLGLFGVVASVEERGRGWSIAVRGAEQLEASRQIWCRHPEASRLALMADAQPTPVGQDLIALEVVSVQQVQPQGIHVYDFSVEADENFICGIGGLCAHNTDADVDGSHIRTLLLTFFYRYFPELIERGHVYMAQPPLYKLRKGKETKWVYSEEERDRELKRMGPKAEVSNRFKGLGEMNADQLWETTMNPETRILLKVEIDDAAAVNEIFEKLMGQDVEPRKKFIQAHAKSVRNLDV